MKNQLLSLCLLSVTVFMACQKEPIEHEPIVKPPYWVSGEMTASGGTYKAVDILQSGNDFLLLSEFQPTGSADRLVHLAKMDASGQTIWSNTYGQTGYQHYPKRVAALPNGGFVVGVTNVGSNSKWHLIWVDANGNMSSQRVLWETAPGNEQLQDIIVDAVEEVIYVTGSTSLVDTLKPDHQTYIATDLTDIMTARIDMSGGIVWSHAYGFPGKDEGKQLFLRGNAVFVHAETDAWDVNTSAFSINTLATVNYRTSSGNIANFNKIEVPTNDVRFQTAVWDANNHGTILFKGDGDLMYAQIDDNLTVIHNPSLLSTPNITGDLQAHQIQNYTDGSFTLMGNTSNNGTTSVWAAQLNSSLQATTQNTYDDLPANMQMGRFVVNNTSTNAGVEIRFSATRQNGNLLVLGQDMLP